uniref:Cytochrome P450 family 4 n=1 Tax=Cyphoma gibbosum TaxID=217775 RepID=B3FYF2_CYPGI|nr:cytochrome P450 family 4 [Cyphoma gibbosum]
MDLGFSSMSLTLQAVVVLVVTTLVVGGIKRLLRYRSYLKAMSLLPGETDHSWIWGDLHKLRNMTSEQRISVFGKFTEKFPKFYRFWLGPFQANIVLLHPDTVKDLFKTADPKPFGYQFGIPWLGEGLLIAGGSKWARSRRLLSPAFHFDILKPYVKVGNEASDKLLEKVKKYADKGESMEMYNNISLCTLDMIMRCAMSYSNDIQAKGESHPYVVAVSELADLLIQRIRNPLAYNDFVYGLTKNGRRFKEQCHYVHGISEQIIQERQKILEREGPPKKRYLDFLDILLTAKDDTGTGLTPLEIRSEVDTFLFEGHDTTASAISWILYSLCQHPDIQEKVQQEIDTVLKGRDSDEIEWSDLPKFEFMTMVIKEGMRLHCPVPFISRVTQKPMILEGFSIPAGSVCTIHIFNIHHNPVVWPDPWEFKPERFHPDNTKDRDSFAFVPFSAGPRNCIGQHFAMNEEKVMLSRLLRRYTFRLDPKYPVVRKMTAIMKTESGMRMFATPRTPTV